MFEFLRTVDEGLYARYLTLERNIKAGSNSFYDAYLDMLEAFVKSVISAFSIECAANETCGAVLKRSEVRSLFLTTLTLDAHTYEKLQDYTLKVNAHKHRSEKKIAVDTIVSYLLVFHRAVSAYCRYRSIEIGPFPADEIYRSFGAYEEENRQLKADTENIFEKIDSLDEKFDTLDEKLDSFSSLFQPAERKAATAEESAFDRQVEAVNNRNLLKDFMIGAEKTYHYMGGAGSLEKDKKKGLIKLTVLLGLGLLGTLFSSISHGYYNPFAMCENLFMLCFLPLIFHIHRARVDYPAAEYSKHSAFPFALDANYVPAPGPRIALRYRLAKAVYIFGFVFNFVFLFVDFQGFVSVLGILFEGAFFIGSFFVFSVYEDVFLLYSAVYFKGYIPNKSAPVVLVLETTLGRFLTKEEYERTALFDKDLTK